MGSRCSHCAALRVLQARQQALMAACILQYTLYCSKHTVVQARILLYTPYCGRAA